MLLCTFTIIMQLTEDEALSQALCPWIYRQVVEAKTIALILACTIMVVMRSMKEMKLLKVSLTMPISSKVTVLKYRQDAT